MQLKASLGSVGSGPPIPRIIGTRCGVVNGIRSKSGEEVVVIVFPQDILREGAHQVEGDLQPGRRRRGAGAYTP